MSGGVALFDFDRDGRLDIYLVDSLTVDTANDPKAARSALYRNLGRLQIRGCHRQGGRRPSGLGHGRLRRRCRRDGWDDLYVTALGGNRCTATAATARSAISTAAAGVAAAGWSTGCGFADYDRDGDLDLFVARYVNIDLRKLPQFGKDKTCEYRGIPVQCGPRGLPGESDFLFRNEGNGRFTEVSEKAGVRRSRRAPSASASRGSMRTTMAGPTCTWPTTRRRTSCT